MYRLKTYLESDYRADRFLFNRILAPSCLSCRTLIDRPGKLCGSCWTKIKFIEPPVCNRLGTPLPFTVQAVPTSAAAIVTPPRYARARITAHYDGLMRELIHRFKFNDRLELKKLFCSWLLHSGRELLKDADIVIPVPLNRWRLWSRRYNQSAILAQQISGKANLPYMGSALVRIRNTRRQIGLTARQRRLNVAGAFHVPEKWQKEVRDKSVLLIDDVITTGATVEACTRALLRSGAESVDILTLARVVHPQQLSY